MRVCARVCKFVRACMWDVCVCVGGVQRQSVRGTEPPRSGARVCARIFARIFGKRHRGPLPAPRARRVRSAHVRARACARVGEIKNMARIVQRKHGLSLSFPLICLISLISLCLPLSFSPLTPLHPPLSRASGPFSQVVIFLTRKGAWHRLISCAGGLRGTHRKRADVNHLLPHRPETLNQSGRAKEWLACQPAIPWPESSPLALVRVGEPKNGCHASSDSLE